MGQTLDILREATRGTPYEGRLFLVGGIVRDKILYPGEPAEEDIDIVLEGDSAELAEFLFGNGVADHRPVTYPRFGTAMLGIAGQQVELVSARRESYESNSRKPSTEPATLLDDVLRRDFTVNSLLENLHTGEVLDLTGQGLRDMERKIIRTPLDPAATFEDDPLRMLRAVRFACRLGFAVHPDTYAALGERAHRLGIISAERVRDEFSKIVMSPGAAEGLEMLRETSLLDQFAPELSAMHGVTQNIYHIHDVWTHTLRTLEGIPRERGLVLRLVALLHDVGKPPTRTVAEDGTAHFYGHQSTGAEMARRILNRLRYPNAVTDHVVRLIAMHLRVGEYDSEWSDAAVRRLLRDSGEHLEELIDLTRADKDAGNPQMPRVDLEAFRAHARRVLDELAGTGFRSPLTGSEIMAVLGIDPGAKVGEAKSFLEDRVVEGHLRPGDKAAAAELLRRHFG